MNKKISLTAFLLFFSILISAQNSEKAGAEITFLNSTVDYDTIERYSNGTRTFVFYNTGNEPLVITNVKSSCSCTVPTWTKEPIPPGGRGEISAKYNTKKPGKFNRPITVNTNAGTHTIKIIGVVVDPVAKYGVTKTK